MISHQHLVERSEKWLRNTLHCRVIATELTAHTKSRETPDAIGWVNGRCILVECKRTRSDFFSDKIKVARREGARALGDWRFYITPPGLLKPSEIPEGWGVYEVVGKKIMHVGGHKYFSTRNGPNVSDRESEIAILVSIISRWTKSTKI